MKLEVKKKMSVTCPGFQDCNYIPATITEGKHPIPFRTRKLSPPVPMVLRGQLRGRVGRCRVFYFKQHRDMAFPSHRWYDAVLRPAGVIFYLRFKHGKKARDVLVPVVDI